MKKIKLLTILFLCSVSLQLHAQKERLGEKAFSLRFYNASGDPLSGVEVHGAEGQIYAVSDMEGKVSFSGVSSDGISLEAEGFATITGQLSEISREPVITLTQLPVFAYEKDKMILPFDQKSKRYLSTQATAVDPKDIFQYDNRQGVLNSILGRVPGMLNNSIRNMGEPLIVIDGIPRDASNLNFLEIDQVTVLKDVNSRILYGSQAANGVIMIKTKRGIANKRIFNVQVESGMQDPIKYPSYLDGASYMELFNEALTNDGQAPRFSSDAINSTRANNSYLFPNTDFYTSDFLKSTASFYSFLSEIGGGNKNSRYYLNLGYLNNGTLLAIGEGANERSDRFNVRGNVDYKLTDWLSMSFDGVGQFGFSGGANYTSMDFWQMAATRLPNAAPFLIPVSEIADESLSSSAVLYNGNNVLGGTSEFQTNPFGELFSKGFAQRSNRTLQINSALNFDFSKNIPGLTGQAAISFDIYNQFVAAQNNLYAVYQPISTANGVEFNRIGQDIKVDDQTVSGVDFLRRVGFYGNLNYAKVINDNPLNIKLIGFRNEVALPNTVYENKYLHFGTQIDYTLNEKFLIQASGVLSGSQKLASGNQFAFAPAVSLGWIVSEEEFLKNNNLVSFLKLKTGYGILNTDNFLDNYLPSRTTFAQSSSFRYGPNAINQNASRILNLGNPNLGWSQRRELNVGLEAVLANVLQVELNYFTSNLAGIPVQRAGFYPATFGGIIPFENYNQLLNSGFELGIGYSKKLGDFNLGIDLNTTYAKPTWKVFDEPNYSNAPERRQEGKGADAFFGYVADGFFTSQADIDSSPKQTFGEVRPGDIKYVDINGDGLIDENDQQVIGNRQRLFTGLQLRVGYKNFDAFLLATSGGLGDILFNSPYDWVYGNRKYSEVVLNRWTEGTAGSATYPRLSANENPNNFRSSTFWLKQNSGVSLNNAQINYNFGKIGANKVKNLRAYVRGSNLLRLGPNAERENIAVGMEPVSRFYAIGLVGSF